MNVDAKNPEIVKLTAEIEAHRKAQGMTRSAFGLWAVNDPSLLNDLDRGRELRWQTIQAIRTKMKDGAAT